MRAASPSSLLVFDGDVFVMEFVVLVVESELCCDQFEGEGFDSEVVALGEFYRWRLRVFGLCGFYFF